MDITVKNAKLILEKYLNNPITLNKYEHSLRVAQICKVLAQRWKAPVQDAIIAGLLHDIGKSQSRQQMLSLCIRNNLTIYDFELFETPVALHGKISSLLFEKEFDKNDSERFYKISQAITSHVTGNDKMSLLDKIVFIADNIEPQKNISLYNSFASNLIDTPDEFMLSIINTKLANSNKKNRISNPMYYSTLESLEKE